MDSTVVPASSHSPRSVGVSSRDRAAQSTRVAPATAAAAVLVAVTVVGRSPSSSTNRARLSARGLCTRTDRSPRTAASARTWVRASKPEPMTATSSAPGGASTSAASAVVAAVRNAVSEFPSRRATSWALRWSNSGTR